MAGAGPTNPTGDRWLGTLRVCPVLLILAFVFCAGSPTTTVRAATRAYDAPTIERDDVQEILVVEAGPLQGSQAREGSVSPSADRGTFTTLYAPVVATNTAGQRALPRNSPSRLGGSGQRR